MATYRKRGNRHQAVVRINGIEEYRSFDTKGEAKAWAEARERLITNATDEFMLEAINYRGNRSLSGAIATQDRT